VPRSLNHPEQLLLFESVLRCYEASPDVALANAALYRAAVDLSGLPRDLLEEKVPVGRSGQCHSLLKREIRWYQQTLKRLNAIEHVDNVRGLWRLTKEGKHRLRRAEEGVALLAFATDLGVAIFGSCRRAFPCLDEPIHLVITSPPFPLRRPRAYGNPPKAYDDFICQVLEPIVANLVPGGSICIGLSNDIFEPGSPARSLYLERLTIALHDRLGLSLMDRLVWHNASKPPGPVLYASLKRVQLNVAYEPVLWFSNDPHKVRSDNRRVLEAHSDRHLRLMAGGGEHRKAVNADGAYRLHPGSYGKETAGRIPRNVISLGHSCPDHRQYLKDATALGLPANGAPMPLSLASFLIRFLSLPGDLVADPFGGRLTTARAAESLNRRWFSAEWILEFIRVAAQRFRREPGFWLNPALQGLAPLP
jgi:DNA modification methylase